MVSLAPSAPPARVLLPPVASAELIGLGAMLAAFVAMAFDPHVLNDGDTYWHLAAGQWMLAHGQVLQRDVFSYTFAGRPWCAQEWLSEVLMALAFRAGGFGGLLVLYATSVAAATGLMADRLKRSLSGLPLAATLVLALACSAGNAFVRPHMLVLPVIVIWIRELLAARERGRGPRWFLAPLMLLWANLHGSFVFGFLLMTPFALEALVEAHREGAGGWRKAVRQWAPVGLACIVAGLLTPNGWEGVVHPFRTMTMGTLNAISEWRPADFSRPGPLEITLLLVLFVALSRGVRVPPLRLALLLFVLHMGLQHGRHQLMLAIVAPLVLAAPLGEALEQAPLPQGRGGLAWPGFAVLALLLATLRLAGPAAQADGEVAPLAALRHVPPALASRPVINSYDFGGALMLKGMKPFIDGREDLYGEAYTERFMAIRAGDRPSLDAAVRQFDVAWTILQPGEPLVAVLDATPGWRRLYSDRYAVVHERILAATPDGQAAARR
jgi:hypothetical protein